MIFVGSSGRAVAVLALSFAGVAIGCSSSGNTAEDGTTGHTEDALDANESPAFSFFVGKGLTTFQAAGIVGNLVQESNVSPTSVQAGGPGRGIAQWSVGGRWDHDANDNVIAYAAAQKESATSLNLQLEFIWYELTTFGYGLSALRATTNVTAATIAFQTDFEGCGTCDETNRISYAKAALAAYGAIPYGATFVGQSFPLATTTLKMKAGEVLPSFIELKNTGTDTWNSSTRLGTTQPRDRVSAFADSSWVSTSRPSQVTGTVAPGATYKFEFNLKAPEKVGTYDEFFGVVQEGVAWFGDPGQGGPVDSDLEVKIQVVAADATDDGGIDETDGGPMVSEDGGAVEGASDPNGTSAAQSNGDQNGAQSGGCSITKSSTTKDSPFTIALFFSVGIALASRRRRGRNLKV